MKTIIIYGSKHHGNTEKLVRGIAKEHDIVLVDAIKESIPDLQEYDCIGFASGIAAGRCYKLYNLLWADGKERLWNMLHDSYVAELDWLNHDKSEFESTEVCEFVANTALYSYQEHLEREEKGKNIDLEQLDKELINKQVDKKHKGEHRRAVWHRILDIINIFKKKK